MPRLETEEIERRHVWLYARDVERIHALFPKLGFSGAVRQIIRKFLDGAEAKAHASVARPVPSLTEEQIAALGLAGGEE
jgi:hypothetical protein